MKGHKETVFPLARIKRIIQSDDDVGRVPKDTALGVGRCVELFLADLVKHAAQEAKASNSKTVSVTHLQACVNKHDMFDFLRDFLSERVTADGQVKKRQKAPTKSKQSEKKQKRVEEEEDSEEDYSEIEEDGDDNTNNNNASSSSSSSSSSNKNNINNSSSSSSGSKAGKSGSRHTKQTDSSEDET